MIYWGPLKPLEHLLLRTVLAPWSYVASFLYHDVYWYNCVGRAQSQRGAPDGVGQALRELLGERGRWKHVVHLLVKHPSRAATGMKMALFRSSAARASLSGTQVPDLIRSIPPRAVQALTGSQFAESRLEHGPASARSRPFWINSWKAICPAS